METATFQERRAPCIKPDANQRRAEPLRTESSAVRNASDVAPLRMGQRRDCRGMALPCAAELQPELVRPYPSCTTLSLCPPQATAALTMLHFQLH